MEDIDDQSEPENIEEKLENPECYLNRQTGDIYIIWWLCNRPTEKYWTRISYECYKVLTRNL